MSGMREEDIDKLKLPVAIKKAKEYKIDLGKSKSLEDVKCILKRHLLQDRQKRTEVISGLTISADENAELREELQKICINLFDSVEHLSTYNKPMLEQLLQYFPNVKETLLREREKLGTETVKCPIMVLGETGSGKSSFINLILGCELLPFSLRSNTNTICEIQYGESHKVILHLQATSQSTEQVVCQTFEELQSLLRRKIQKQESETSQQMYKRAEIFLPVDILKTGLLIVDSPGIADTREMTDIVLNYLIDASAFIYIINSTNAGGVAPERLQELLLKVVQKSFRDEQDFRPECALFVCNKWDQIHLGERERVLEDTIQKLTGPATGWPGCKRSQIFTLSTREATFIQSSEEKFVVGQFASLLREIFKLVPTSRQILLTKSLRLLKQIVDKALLIVDHNMKDLDLSEEEKQQHIFSTKENLRCIKREVSDFFEKENIYLKKQLDSLTYKLGSYLQDKEVVNRICSISRNDVQDKPWNEASVLVRSLLYDKLSEEIHKWEKSHCEFENLGMEMSRQFLNKFPEFNYKLQSVEQNLSQASQKDTSEKSIFLGEEQVPFVPLSITQKFTHLNLGFKVLIGVTLSPVFLIGAIARLPVWGGKELKRKYDIFKVEKMYNDSTCRIEALQRYAKIVLQATIDPYKMRPIIEEKVQPLVQYLEQQRLKVIAVIDADLAMIDMKKEDRRRRDSVLASYIDSKNQFQNHNKDLLFFHKMKMPVSPSFIPSSHLIYSEKLSVGITQELLNGHLTVLEGNTEVMIRKSKLQITKDNIISYMREEEVYHTTMSTNVLISCHGFVQFESQIWQVLVKPECTFRVLVDRELRSLEGERHEKYAMYTSQVASGLEFLHKKGLVHIDLSMDSIMVDSSKKVKLVNINSRCRLPKDLFPANSTDIQSYVHFHPNILTDPESNEYNSNHDMYSVGVIMWEMWTNRRPFAEQVHRDKSISSLLDFGRFVSHHHNRYLALELEDGKGILYANFWEECIKVCQDGRMKATELVKSLHEGQIIYVYKSAQCPIQKK